MRKFQKNCVALVRQDDKTRALQKLPETPTLPAESNNFILKKILKQNIAQTSFLCRACELLSGIYKAVTGNKPAFAPEIAHYQNIFAPKIHAFVINKNGRRILTKKRYKTVLAHAHKFGLFIDGFTKKVCHNSKNGELMTDTEFIMIKTYMETGKPLAPFQVTGYVREYKKTEQDLAWNDKKLHDIWEQNDTINDEQWKLLKDSSEVSEDILQRLQETATRIFESARKKADIKLNGKFRCLPQVQRKGRDRLAKYQFKPENLSYCLIIPS